MPPEVVGVISEANVRSLGQMLPASYLLQVFPQTPNVRFAYRLRPSSWRDAASGVGVGSRRSRSGSTRAPFPSLTTHLRARLREVSFRVHLIPYTFSMSAAGRENDEPDLTEILSPVSLPCGRQLPNRLVKVSALFGLSYLQH